MEYKEYKSFSNVDAVEILHNVAEIYTSTKTPHDYGTGEVYTHTEVHTLKNIADAEGITITELAKCYGKTKGAFSQILKKLEQKELIYRQVDESNENRYKLFLTERGKELDAAHRRYDEIYFGESMNVVREQFSDADINTTFQVLETWLNVRREVQIKRIARNKEKLREERNISN